MNNLYKNGNWVSGFIDTASERYQYAAKVYAEKSEDYGINGGNVSKLEIRIDGIVVVNYDRGWDVEPSTEEAQGVVALILKKYEI